MLRYTFQLNNDWCVRAICETMFMEALDGGLYSSYKETSSFSTYIKMVLILMNVREEKGFTCPYLASLNWTSKRKSIFSTSWGVELDCCFARPFDFCRNDIEISDWVKLWIILAGLTMNDGRGTQINDNNWWETTTEKWFQSMLELSATKSQEYITFICSSNLP